MIMENNSLIVMLVINSDVISVGYINRIHLGVCVILNLQEDKQVGIQPTEYCHRLTRLNNGTRNQKKKYGRSNFKREGFRIE